MAEQARSTETNIQEMLLKIVNKLDKFEQEREQDRQEFKQEFRNMEENSNKKFKEMREQFDKKIEQNEKFEKLQNEIKSEIKQDIKVEFLQVRGEFQEELTVINEDNFVKTDSKLSSSQKRRIRKVRLMKFFDIKISKFRKRLMKQIRSGRMRITSDSKVTKCKRNTSTNPNKVKNNEVFRTNPNENETKVFRVRYEKVNKQQESVFTKTNTCVPLTRWQGEKRSPNRNNWDTNSNFQSEHLHEKCINCVKLKFQGEISNERLKKRVNSD
jgi:hypothetical protein